jgi:YVTN family beta-propeller protein
VVSTINVGNSPNGVSVNPNTNKAYVANNYDNTVSVIDGGTNKVVATLPGTEIPPAGITVGNSPQDVSVNPDTNKAYVANYDDNTVSVIDGRTNKVLSTINVGNTPYGVSVNPDTNMAYVANRNNGTVSVINGETNSVITNINVGRLPNDVKINPLTNLAYVSNEQDNTISVIDGNRYKVIPIK